jgi:hypothetical protein
MSEWCSETEAFARAEIRFPGVTSIRAALADAMRSGDVARRGGRTKGNLDYVPVLNPGENYPGLIDDLATAVQVNIGDLEKWMRRVAGLDHPVVETMPPRTARRRGTAPEQRNRVLAEMRAFGVNELQRWSQEAMATQFKASRETCMKALAMLEAETSK